jgi:hypothetical protein
MKNLFSGLLLVGLLLPISSIGLAAEGTPWHELTPEQRQLLQKAHEDRWNSMPAEAQKRMLEGAERWQKMTPGEREKIRARREKFRNLPPDERRRLMQKHRARHEALEKLPPERQQAIRDCWKRRKSGEDVDCRGLWPSDPHAETPGY